MFEYFHMPFFRHRIFPGKRYSLDDPELKKFEDTIQDMQTNLIRYSIQDFAPWIRYVLPNYIQKILLKEEKANELRNSLKNFLKVCILSFFIQNSD